MQTAFYIPASAVKAPRPSKVHIARCPTPVEQAEKNRAALLRKRQAVISSHLANVNSRHASFEARQEALRLISSQVAKARLTKASQLRDSELEKVVSRARKSSAAPGLHTRDTKATKLPPKAIIDHAKTAVASRGAAVVTAAVREAAAVLKRQERLEQVKRKGTLLAGSPSTPAATFDVRANVYRHAQAELRASQAILKKRGFASKRVKRVEGVQSKNARLNRELASSLSEKLEKAAALRSRLIAATRAGRRNSTLASVSFGSYPTASTGKKKVSRPSTPSTPVSRSMEAAACRRSDYLATRGIKVNVQSSERLSQMISALAQEQSEKMKAASSRREAALQKKVEKASEFAKAPSRAASPPAIATTLEVCNCASAAACGCGPSAIPSVKKCGSRPHAQRVAEAQPPRAVSSLEDIETKLRNASALRASVDSEKVTKAHKFAGRRHASVTDLALSVCSCASSKACSCGEDAAPPAAIKALPL